jgi:photosystem II stability/assembly factor-like uncharacterized protein
MGSRAPLLLARTLAAFLAAAGGAGAQTDGGIPLGTPTVLAVHPANPAILYAAFADVGLFRSADRGGSWERFGGALPGVDVVDLVIDPFHPSILYVLEAVGGLFKSRDGGLAWEAAGAGLPSPAEVRGVVADPDEPFTLFAATRQGVFRSVDGAATFQPLGLSPPAPVQVLFHPRDVLPLYATTADALFVSLDFGVNWQQLGQIGAQTRSVAIDPSNAGVLYAATAGGVRASVDDGRTWADGGLPFPVWQLAFDALGGLLAATDRGVFRLPAFGAAWQPYVEAAARAIALDPFDPRALYVADGDAQLLLTRDGGLTLETSLRAVVPPPASLGREALIETTARQPRRQDVTLRLAVPARPDDPVAALAVHPDHPEVVYAAGRGGVFRGSGYGESWEPVGDGLELLDVHALAVDPRDPTILYAGTHGAGLFRSRDAGRSWQPARHGLDLAAIAALAVDPLEPFLVYAAGRGGLYASSDYGGSWALLDDHDEVRTLELLAPDPLEVAAGTASGRLLGWSVTANVGRRSPFVGLGPASMDARLAQAYVVDPGRLEIRDLTVDPEAAETLFAATLFGVWKSADAGRAFSPYELGHNVTAVTVDPRDPTVLWAGTTEGLLRQAEGRWSRVKVPGVARDATVYSVAAAPDPPATVVYAGLDDGTVASSRDSGATWTLRRLREPPPAPVKLGIAASRLPKATGEAFVARLRLFFEETPETSPRRRALLAMELAARVTAGDEESEARDELEKLLGEILALQRRRGEESVHDLRFSGDSRWLVSDLRFDDGERGHNELRLVDLGGLRLRPGGPLPYSEERLAAPWPPWRALADVAREPEHLHPTWVIADPGVVLDWSPGGGYLATRADADRVSVWRIAAPRRPEASRFEPQRPAAAGEQWLGLAVPGLDVLAWSTGESHLAVAGPRDFVLPGSEAERRSVVRLADLERPRVGRLVPVRVSFEETVSGLAFTPEGRWLWIRGEDDAEAHWALLVPRAGRWALVFERDGDLWRVAPQTRLRDPFVDAPEAFAELAASPDGGWLAGRGAAADGTAAGEVLLWSLGARGPEGKPSVLTSAAAEGGPRFSSDSRCLGLERSRRWLRDLSDQDCQRRVAGADRGGLVWPFVTPAVERPAYADGDGVIVLDGWGCRGCRGAPLKVWRRGGAGWETVGLPAPLAGIERMSPDHRWVATARSEAETHGRRPVRSPVLELWDVEEPRPAGLRVRAGRFGARELHRDEVLPELAGRTIVYWDRPRTRRTPETDLLDRACQVLGRNLTQEEWRRYAGDAPYEPVCTFVRKRP